MMLEYCNHAVDEEAVHKKINLLIRSNLQYQINTSLYLFNMSVSQYNSEVPS